MPAGGLFIHPGAHAPGKHIVCPALRSTGSMRATHKMMPMPCGPAEWVAPPESVPLAGTASPHFDRALSQALQY